MYIVDVLCLQLCGECNGLQYGLLGHPIIMYLYIPRSMYAQFEYCMSLLSYSCVCYMLYVRMTRSST